MRKHKREMETSTQWYQNMKLMLGVGIGGIIIVLGLLAVLTNTIGNSNSAIVPVVPERPSGDVQEIKMIVTGGSYQPSILTVEAGKPVKWNIDGTRASGCTTYLLAPELGVNKRLTSGANVVEFIAPTKPGAYGFSCSMGMVKGTLNVV